MDNVRKFQIFYILTVIYLVVSALYLNADFIYVFDQVAFSTIGVLISTALCLAIMKFYNYVFYTKPEYPIRQMMYAFYRTISNPASLGRGIPLVFFAGVFVGSFLMVKVSIQFPDNSPFDLRLTELERTLHFGKLPWEWLQPLLGYWPITFLINWNYQIWLIVIWGFLLFFLFSENSKALRTRYILSFMAAWMICGSLMATMFASAGPCYFAELGITPNPYMPLMNYLNGIHTQIVPLPAILAQELLWNGYSGENGRPLGISAMPSLHNAIALLNVLASWKLSRRLACIMAIHALLVALGSVHLGWHYAVDVYVAWAVILILWVGAKPIALWWDKRTYRVEHTI